MFRIEKPLGRLLRGPTCGLISSLAAAAVAGCSGHASMFRPQGPAAAEITGLWWLLFWLALAVFAAFMVFMLVAIGRNRGAYADEAAAQRRGARIVLLAGIIGPALILLVVLGATIWTLQALRSPVVAEEDVIHVVGRRWWWEVQYPAYQFATANEIHIPVGRPVRLVLTSPNVIHSFWVPELQGKMDLIPGETNTMWLRADRPGIYRGECAEFCGIQHAKMSFLVVAQPQDEYAAWLDEQRRPAQVPTDRVAQTGQTIFLNSNCIECHTVRGTPATGHLGPDLTHLASRRTLASATVDNNLGNLAGWVAAPQHIKPGNLMPPANLTGVELQALLAYLAALK